MKISLDEVNAMPLKRLRVSFNEKLDVEGAAKPVVGELDLASSAGGMTVNGRVQTLLKLNCHVCLRPYFQSLTVDIDEQFSADRHFHHVEEQPRDRELTKDDFYESLPEDGVLDISDIVYQAVTLASPVFYRCGDECPGPPKSENAVAGDGSGAAAAADRNSEKIDPRWENLKTLFSNKETGENS